MRLASIKPPAPPTTRERLTALLDAMAYGLFPADGSATSPETAQDIAALTAGIMEVEDARTDAGILAAYTGCLLRLAGVNAESVSACAEVLTRAEVLRAGAAALANGGAR